MNDNDFKIVLSALLDQSKSKKQINTDIKELEQVINSLRLVATFNKADTKRNLNAYIKQLEEQLSTLKLKAKFDNKNLKREISQALNNVSYKDIDLLNIDENKTKLKAKKAIADIKAYVEKNTISLNIELKKEKLNNQLTTYLNKNSKIRESEVLLKEADKIRDKIAAINDKDSLRNATDSFQLFKSEVQSTGYQAMSTTDKIKNMVSGITKIGSMFGVATIAINNFRKSLQTLKSNDTILTEISKTSEMTKQQLVELGNEAFKTASKYGQLSSNYLVAVQEMARSGYEDTSKELGELSLLAQSAGDMTAENANNFLLATDAAYKYSGSIEKLNAALDGANYISNKNSASLTDIADGIRVSASYAANAGVAIEEVTAAEATMIATTKRSGSEMGRAFRSIILNLQQVSGEFDGEVIDEEQLKKVEARCHSLGVELEYVKDGVATLRNPMEILKDLAEVYNSLPDNSADKQGLISDLGGKYHANALSSLLSRWDLYEKMLEEYSKGTNSALEEANKTADSWEGRLNSMQNSWDSFVNSLTNKNVIKGGISFFDNSIQAAETLVDTIGEIPVLLTTINTAMVAMNKDYGLTQVVNPETNKLDIQGNIFGIDFSAIKAQKKHFEEAGEAITIWNQKLANGATGINSFNNEIVKNNAQLKDYLSTCSKDAPASLSGYKAYLNAAGVSTDALRLKTVLLNSAISLGIGAAIQGATWLISKGIGAIDDYAHRVEKCKERVDDMVSAFNSAIDTADSHKKTIEEIGSRYEELSKGVNALGENVSLTTEEYAEYNDICNQIAEMFPTMVQGYTSEGDAILNLKGNVDALTKAYEEEAQAAYKALIASGKDSDGNDIIADWKYSLEEDKGKGTNITRAIEELQAFMTSDMDAEMYTALREKASAGIYDGMTDAEKLIAGSEFLPFKIQFDLDENGIITDEELAKAKESAKVLLQTYNAEIESSFNNTKLLANAYLMTNEDFKKLDEQSQSAASLLINSIPATSDIAQVLMTRTKEEIGEYVNFIVQALSADNPDVKNALINLLTLDTEDMSPDKIASVVDNYISTIADYLHRDENELKIQLGFEDVDALKTQYQHAIDYAKEKFDGYDPTTFFEENSINTQEEIDKWLGIAQAANSAAEAEEAYIQVSEETIPSFFDIFNSSDFADVKEKLLDLAKSGEITASVLESTEEYKKLLDQTGLSAEEAKNKITNMLSVQEKLSAASNGLDNLSKAYKEFKDEDIGFVTASTIESLPDVFKSLDGFDLFSEIVGDPNSGVEKIQQAFNDITKQYLIHQNTFSGLLNSSEADMNSYIANLKQMGVTNAEEVVQQVQAVLSQESELINAAEEELLKAHIEQLKGKGDADLQYLEDASSKNGQLISALGNAYQTDYSNWCDLLSKKAEAYNEFVNAIGGSYDANHDVANNLVQNGNSNPNSWDIAAGEAAQSAYNQTVAEANKMKEAIKLDLSTIKTNFGSSFSPNYSGSSSSSKSSKSETAQTFDWIETKLENISKATDKLAKKFEKTFTVSSTNKKYKEYLSQIEEEIKANNNAISAYNSKLSSIGLSSDWAKKVRDGDYSISSITDDDLKEKISDYQDYYDKVKDCQDKITELEEERAEAQNTYAEKIIEYQEKEIKALETSISKRESLISLKEKFGGTASQGDLEYEQGKYKDQITLYDNQIDKLKELQKTVSKGSDAWNTYQDQIDSYKESVLDVSESIADLAVKIANLPIDKYEKYVEDNNSKSEYYSAKAENYASAKNKNKMIDEQIKLLTKNNNKAQSTADTTAKNLTSSIKAISSANSTDKKKATSSEKKELSTYYKEVQSYTKSKKEISSSLITKISNAGFGNLAKACVNYNAALSANETAKATADLMKQTTKTEIAELAVSKFNNIQTEYERKQGVNTNKANLISAKMDLATAKGYLDSQSWYNQLLQYEKKNQSSLKKQLKESQDMLNSGLKDGSITKGSDQYWEMVDAINSLEESLADCNTQIAEFNKQLRQIEFDNFDFLTSQIERMTSEADYYINLLSSEAMTKDGSLTDSGIATMGLHVQNYDTYIAEANKYADEISRIDEMLAKDPNNTDLLEQKQKYIDLQEQAILNAQNEKEAVADLIKEGYDALIDSLTEAANKYKELLQNAKDAHDYQNSISEKSEEANTLRKQIEAYKAMSGNEEIAAKLQEANKQLADTEKDIQETMYEKYISDTQDALDDMIDELETFINEIVDDIDKLFQDALTIVDSNTSDISATLTSLSNEYGTTLSTALSSIWGNGYTPEKGFNSVVSAIEKLISESDKQSDKTAYNTASANYTDTSSYEKAVASATQRVNELTTGSNNIKKQLDNVNAQYNSSLNQQSAFMAKYSQAESETQIAKNRMDEAKKKYGTKSTQYMDAKAQYEQVNANVKAMQPMLTQLQKQVTELQKQREILLAEYNSIQNQLSDARGKESQAKSELSSVLSSDKSVIKQFLQAIVNYDTEPGSTALDKKVSEITNGGALSSYNRSQLATLLGCSNDDSTILEKLKQFGFYNGGIASVSSGILKKTGEDGWVLARNGEGFVSPENVKDIRELMNVLPDITRLIDIPTPTLPVFERSNVGGGDVNVSIDEINLPNVTNYEEFKTALIRDSKFEKAIQSMTIDRVVGGHSMSKYKYI